jgi:peptide/nickel transport system substrate-binding protein
MSRTLWRVASLLAALIVAVALAACGGDDDEESGGGGGGGGGDNAQEGSPATKAGGEATFNLASFPDFLDPALSYTVAGIQELQTTHLSLLTYKRVAGQEGATLIPGLAEDMPKVSEDNTVYTFTLREGLKYSDGSPVKASDFAHTIKRVLNLESGGSSFYLAIKGAEEYVKAGKARGDISGIETDDATREIKVTLTEANGQFPYIIAMWFAGLVPADTPFENQTKSPPPGVGPFRFKSVELNRGFVLEKNPNYTPIPGVPEAKLDVINGTVVKNATSQVQQVLQNEKDWIDDPPANDAVREFRQTAKERYRDEVTNSTYYFFLNHREKPFDNEDARKAVNFAVDKRALARLSGGQSTPACNFLPPGMQGFKKLEPCPYGDPNAAPDVEKAKQMIQDAGVAGEEVTVYGNDEESTKAQTEYLADVMNQIGLKAKPRIIEASVYFTTIGNQKTKAQAGFSNWFQDFPHPGNFLFLVEGRTIQKTNNQNYGNVDDPEINKLTAEANKLPLDEAADEYAEVDKRLVEGGHVVAWGNRKIPVMTSDKIAFEEFLFHPVLQSDLTTLALK